MFAVDQVHEIDRIYCNRILTPIVLFCSREEALAMTSEGVTKVDLHKQQLSTKPAGQEEELDKEDFQKAAQDAKESVSNTLQSAKEFVVGGSNDADNKMTEQTAQVSELQHSFLMTSQSDGIL